MIPRLSLTYFAFGYPIASSLFVEKFPWLNCIAFLFFKWQKISNEAKSLAPLSKLSCFFVFFLGGTGQFGQIPILYMPSYEFVPREKQHKLGDHFLNFSINDLNSHLVFFTSLFLTVLGLHAVSRGCSLVAVLRVPYSEASLVEHRL